MNKLIIGVVALVVLWSVFSPKKVDLAIDNPLDHPVFVSIDELNVEVPANDVVWVEMGRGEHTVSLEDGTKEPFDFSKKAYFLNPTKSEYLVEEHFYGDLSARLSYMNSNPDKKVEYMGMEFEGRYDVVKDLITPVTWDVGARESMPESVQADADDNYVVLKKLLDQNEFIEMMMRAAAQQKAEEEEAAE